MKYKLLKDLPLAKAGTEVVVINNTIIGVANDNVIAEIRQDLIPEWLEEVKETPKTIYDLEKGSEYYLLDKDMEIIKGKKLFTMKEGDHKFCFLTEREAKRHKLLRELATRTDKWLPEKGDTWVDLFGNTRIWYFNTGDNLYIHLGIIFKDIEEYSKYMTNEAKDLLFNP